MAVRAQDVEELPRQLAALVLCPRVRLQAIYDDLIAELATEAEPFLAAALDDDCTPAADDAEAFTRAFSAAARGNWLEWLVRRCVKGLVMHERALQLLTPGKQRTVLQAVFDLARGYDDPHAYASGLLRTIPKICLVKARLKTGQTQGTGFLIGPQTVLTAWHVIEPLLDAASGQPSADSHKRLEVRFDFLDPVEGVKETARRYYVQEQWLGEHSPCHASEKPSARGMDSQALSGAIDANHLDFAVIRLKGSPGRDRGVVKLSRERLQLSEDAPTSLLVFQHPNQFPQRFVAGRITGYFGNGEPPPRLRHQANTEHGSSGGLCVDAEFESIGLHQAAVIDPQGEAVANQAIPTALIVPLLNHAFTVDPTLDPLWQLKATHEPVIGREDFQNAVWQAVRGEKRILIVRGPARSGLSFSKQILKSMLPDNGVIVVEMSADAVGRDALALASRLLERVGGGLAPGERFPDAAAAATTREAWLRNQLVPDLLGRMRTAVAGKSTWLVLDDLDRHDIPDGDARAMLLALLASDVPWLRFLLLGGKFKLSGVPVDWVDDDAPGWPLADLVDIYIQRRCTANNVSMSAAERSRWTQAVMIAAEAAPDDQWQAAVQFLITYLHPVTEA